MHSSLHHKPITPSSSKKKNNPSASLNLSPLSSTLQPTTDLQPPTSNTRLQSTGHSHFLWSHYIFQRERITEVANTNKNNASILQPTNYQKKPETTWVIPPNLPSLYSFHNQLTAEAIHWKISQPRPPRGVSPPSKTLIRRNLRTRVLVHATITYSLLHQQKALFHESITKS